MVVEIFQQSLRFMDSLQQRQCPGNLSVADFVRELSQRSKVIALFLEDIF
jgi:hypothetical protein